MNLIEIPGFDEHPIAMIRCYAVFIGVATILCNCASQREDLTPRPDARTVSSGATALTAPLFPDSARWGEVAFWSQGAFMRREGAQRRGVVHVGLELANDTDAPLTLDLEASRGSVTSSDRELSTDLRALSPRRLTVPARGRETYDIYFGLPEDVPPQAVDHFSFTFEVERRGERMKRTLGFREEEPQRVYYYDPFLDPFPRYPYWWHRGHPYFW